MVPSHSQPPTLHLRPAHPGEELFMAAICARAFFNEDLFGRVIHPHRAAYPNDVQVFWHECLRHEWASPRNKIIVAVTADEGQPERVVGVAIWQRQGDDAGAQRVMEEWTDPGAWPALKSSTNRALDPSKKTLLQDSVPYTRHYWAGPCTANWYLSLCCVDPELNGPGCGRLLVEWGLERAKEEGIVASVVSSEGSDEFYLKCGFDEVVGNANEGEGNPLRKTDVKGGNILFMWVKGVQEVTATGA